MGSSSLIVICRSWKICGHINWNQNESKKAPHPQVPEVSDVSEISGWDFLLSVIMDRPFHCSMKQCHHDIGPGLFVEEDKGISASMVGRF